MTTKPRPEPGTVTESEITFMICGECGYIIEGGTFACSVQCEFDGDTERPKTIRAIYKRTDVFLRDEIVRQEE